jgi:hypothetical protein
MEISEEFFLTTIKIMSIKEIQATIPSILPLSGLSFIITNRDSHGIDTLINEPLRLAIEVKLIHSLTITIYGIPIQVVEGTV